MNNFFVEVWKKFDLELILSVMLKFFCKYKLLFHEQIEGRD
jgi:hypothetical protein